VLGISRHDLVTRSEVEPGHHDVAAVSGRSRQRDPVRARPDQLGDLCPHAAAKRKHVVEPGPAPATVLLVEAGPLRHRLERSARERAERARIEIGEALEDRKLRSRFGRSHSTSRSTGV
jgi:hypothetical protein